MLDTSEAFCELDHNNLWDYIAVIAPFRYATIIGESVYT